MTRSIATSSGGPNSSASESGGSKLLAAAPPFAAAAPPRLQVGRVRLQTLVGLRWIALAGQTLALLVAQFALGFDVPLAVAFAAIGVSAALNVYLFARFPAATRLSDWGATRQLGFDLAQLSALLYLTGGLSNPFAVLMLVPVTISATILSRRSTLILGGFALALVSVLALFYQPLPWEAPGLALPALFLAGVWVALALGMVFIAAYTSQVAEEARRMSDALAATQTALARERQLSAVGGLAAAAAHELGTPLGTIALAVGELVKILPPEHPAFQDIQLIGEQSKRCRDVLVRLAGQPLADEVDVGFSALPLSSLVDLASAPHRRPGLQFAITLDAPELQPLIGRSPEILHGLGALIENAFDFARTRVDLILQWDEKEIRVLVRDDGPGITVDIMSALGEPYTTSRPGEGMGLGVFIAQTLLGHTGADVRLRNRAEGGAEVSVIWPRAALEISKAAAGESAAS